MVAAQGVLRLLSLGRITSTHLRSDSTRIRSEARAGYPQVIVLTVSGTQRTHQHAGDMKLPIQAMTRTVAVNLGSKMANDYRQQRLGYQLPPVSLVKGQSCAEK